MIISKGTKDRKPRCEATTHAGEQCRLHGALSENGKWVCGRHRKGANNKLRSMKSRPLVIPKELIYIATYSNGIDIRRKDIPAASRSVAYELARNRAPSRFKLTALRMKKGELQK